jgi:uncharacterized integral membrane protein
MALLLFIVFGLFFGYFATLNTSLVSVHFGIETLANIPLYVLVISSFAVGVMFASIFYYIKLFGAKLLLRKKESDIEEKQKEAAENLKKAHQLELENAKLKTKKGIREEDEESI